MNILCATDDNYVQHYYIMLLSLFDNNPTREVDVYILVPKLTEQNQQALNSISKKPSHRVNLIEVDDKYVECCPVTWLSSAAYYRILAPILLPKEVEKILYLDGDMIVCKDLVDLYSTDIDDYAIGAVLDPCYCSQEHYVRLEYSPSLGYINAGMLLMNLNYWREHHIMEECLDFIHDFPEKNRFHDQDAINYVLRERKRLLPIKYNFQTYFLLKATKTETYIKEEIYKIIESNSQTIIHFIGEKPWNSGCYSPYKEYYFKYKRLSPYAKTPIIRKHSRLWIFKRWLYNTLSRYDIVKPCPAYIVRNGKLDL